MSVLDGMAPSVQETINAVVTRWRQSPATVRGGALIDAMEEFEGRYDVLLPTAMRSLYSIADGMEDDCMDEDQFRFWPIHEIVPTGTLSGAAGVEGMFVFADHSFGAVLYAVKLLEGSDHGSVFIVGGVNPMLVSPDFLYFLLDYLRGSMSLFGSRSASMS